MHDFELRLPQIKKVLIALIAKLHRNLPTVG